MATNPAAASSTNPTSPMSATRPAVDDPIEAIAQLEEPNRRRLYDIVVASVAPVGRDEAAADAGMSRELAAFHLDQLVKVGLLTTEFRRRSGRTGPGAGRPAKLYRRAAGDVAVSLPARHYDQAAEVLATALDRLGDEAAVETVTAVARERGSVVGAKARKVAGLRPGARKLRAALLETLRGSGYEPAVEPATGTVRLRNCPYDALVGEHRELTCGMNLAWAEGLVHGLGEHGLRPTPVTGSETGPGTGYCCVEFRTEGPTSES